jgi:hypothetical protein
MASRSLARRAVSLGRVSAGSETNFTLGGNKPRRCCRGAENKVNRNIALTIDLDRYGKESDQVKAATATVCARYSF